VTTTPDFLLGTWVYRSFLSILDVKSPFDKLEFGVGEIRIDAAPMNVFTGLIYGEGWELDLTGSINYGNPVTLRFQGRGVVDNEEWIYDYEGYVVRPWPSGVDQVSAIVGTIVRTIPHGASPAGVVAQWIALKH